MALTIGQKAETRPENDSTPHSITGVQLTSLGDTAISIDWISVTLPNTPGVVRSIEGSLGKFIPEDTRTLGYSQSSRILTTGRVFWSDDKPEAGLHIRLPASALSEYQDGYWLLLNILLNNGGRFTRLDIAYDDTSGLVDLDVIAHHWHTGEVVTRFRSMVEYREAVKLGQGQAELSGLTFGSRQSQSYLRIYDKALEQRKKGRPDTPDHWTRLELELKDEKATAVVTELLKRSGDEPRAVYLVGLLTGLFDLVLSPGGDTNKSRWARPDWWKKFISGCEKVRLSLAKIDRTIEQVKGWFQKFVAPMAAVILTSHSDFGGDGYNWMIEAIIAGQSRWKNKHKILAGIA